MGLFDTVYVSDDVAAGLELRCAQCDQTPPANYAWQTKSLDPCMFSYVLRHDDAGSVRLYLLDRPVGSAVLACVGRTRRSWRARPKPSAVVWPRCS